MITSLPVDDVPFVPAPDPFGLPSLFPASELMAARKARLSVHMSPSMTRFQDASKDSEKELNEDGLELRWVYGID